MKDDEAASGGAVAWLRVLVTPQAALLQAAPRREVGGGGPRPPETSASRGLPGDAHAGEGDVYVEAKCVGIVFGGKPQGCGGRR